MTRTTKAAVFLAISAIGCSSADLPRQETTARVEARLDTSACPAGTNVIAGTDGDDVLVGGNGRDCIVGGAGNDQLFGGNGEDVLLGGDGNDVLVGGNGRDDIDGGAGRDFILGGNGQDQLRGGDGDDVIDPGNGAGTVAGGAGTDSCSGAECEQPGAAADACDTDADCSGGRCSAAGVCIRCLADSECDDGNACTLQVCQPALGCSNPNEADGTPCPNDTVCDGLERCVAGACSAGPPLVCDDGRFCNGAETCDPVAACRAGAPPALDDGVACTFDSCSEIRDRVEHAPNDGLCSDGVFCNGAERCDATAGCQAGVPVTCTAGFTCAGSGCVNVNECATGTHTCSPNADCFDTIGSYTCRCRFGYEGDGRTCDPRCSPVTVATGVERCVRARPDSTVDLRESLTSPLWTGPVAQSSEPIENYCGPTAVRNFLSWYGTDEDYLVLGSEMRTNTWDGATVFAAVALAGPLVGCVEPICWGIVTAIVSDSLVRAGTLPGDMLGALQRRAPPGYVACMKSFDGDLENLRGALADGNPIIFLESGGGGNLHWAVVTGIGSASGDLIVRVDNSTTGTATSTWSALQTAWSLEPVGDGALRGLLSALFGLHPYTYLRWIPADQADGDRCP